MAGLMRVVRWRIGCNFAYLHGFYIFYLDFLVEDTFSYLDFSHSLSVTLFLSHSLSPAPALALPLSPLPFSFLRCYISFSIFLSIYVLF